MATHAYGFTAAPAAAEPRPQVRRIGQADLNWALAEGWRDFKAKRGDLIILALVYPIVGLATAAAAVNAAFLPMLFPLVAGLSIMGPAVASGFYELARRREAGLESDWGHFFDPLRDGRRASLAILTAGLVVMFAAWLAVAALIYAATMGPDHGLGLATFFRSLFTTSEGWALIVAGNLAGFAFAVVTLVLSLVSFPMVVDRPENPALAVETSIRAIAANPAATASWGVRVAVLLAIGCLPMFVGLAVVLPVLGYATWHLYTRLVAR